MRFWKIHCGSLLKRCVIVAVVIFLLLLWKILTILQLRTNERTLLRSSVPFPAKNCHGTSKHESEIHSEVIISFNESRLMEKRILILTKQSSMIKTLIPVLEANRFLFDIHYLASAQRDVLPSFTDSETGKYSAVIFTSFSDYFTLSSWNKRLLDRYCRSFGIGMVLFNQGEGRTTKTTEGFPFKLSTNIRQLKSYYINSNTTILRLIKPENVLEVDDRSEPKKWSIFMPYDKYFNQFEVVSAASFVKQPVGYKHVNLSKFPEGTKAVPVVIHDAGKQDGIHRVYFGAGLTFWLHKLLFLDALGFVSGYSLLISLERWIQIDIDDIFVGKQGVRMKKEDVKALVLTQHNFQKTIPGFHFNLGFSGKYFLHGNDEENEGDQELLKNTSEFWWFDHMWSHKQPHLVDDFDELKKQMELNIEFAKKHNIPLDMAYSVAPHHSGVYPAHDLLYKVWSEVVGVKVTSTEEYPHLKPSWKRRGFIYRDVMVLPRQTCGLFTHTLFLEEYPKGKQQLLDSIYGGELFQLFINNPINIFMTHLSNYGSDRLALYTFTNVIKFVQCWTNLRIMSLPPLDLAKKYFELHPSEINPIWQNPCTDRRHTDIWPAEKSCNRLPSFLIVGPQKTGTTALYMFLSVHPGILRNRETKKNYEETQFFSSVRYYNGLDWYLDLFPEISDNDSKLLFEKSANYFDSNKTPMRAHALIPDAKIIVILMDPVRRAYSWFQHVRSHNNKVALNIGFYDLLTHKNATNEFHTLRKRCLVPGLYAEHLERWLTYYPPSQILTIDGEQLRDDPVSVMTQLQSFVKVKKVIDYGTKLRYSERKGFFCLVTKSGKTNCLGRSKGRKYPPISENAEEFLRDFYREPNRQLVELLHKIRRPLPHWLSTDVVELRGGLT